jgi:acetyl esterase/lipase
MFNKNIFIIFIMFFSLLVQAQEYRYTNTIFSSSNSTENVVYQTAPSINSPYTIESNTLNEDLKMDIYLPEGDTNSKRPAIILAHSGGFLLGSKNNDDMIAFCDSLAKKGYVTATIDYRLGFNLITNVNMHGTRAVYRGIQDGMAAVRYLRANASDYNIDENKVYFIGSSAGSFIGLHSIYMDDTELPSEINTENQML